MNTTNDTERPIYEIPARNLPMLQEKLAEMNKRAAKLGCEPTTLTVIEEYEVERKRKRTGHKYMVKFLKIEVVGQSPKLNGWRLMAAIEMQDSGENMVRNVPGQTVPESYRFTDTHCDHCKTQRYRKEVFILHHDDGRFAQVGRSCIADFLGHVSMENICGRAEWEFALESELKSSGDEDYCGRRGESHEKSPISSPPRRSASVVWAGCRGPRPRKWASLGRRARQASPRTSALATIATPRNLSSRQVYSQKNVTPSWRPWLWLGAAVTAQPGWRTTSIISAWPAGWIPST